MIGLGFGDCGKGLFTDYLCRRWSAHTVVRFNGGAQAGHNVVLPDGRHHTFSQFGAGSFVAGVGTLLAYPVVVHPTALLVESACLQWAGVGDGLDRLIIDARCRLTTPFHQAAGRLREVARGPAAHGSCGVGVGETVRQALARPEHLLRYADLCDPARALVRLEASRLTLLAECLRFGLGQSGRDELALLADATLARRWLALVGPLVRRVPPASSEVVRQRLRRPGCIVFEGAQGVLLDEWHGFHPHTTWSSTGTPAVEAVLADAGQHHPVRHFGVLRSYLTRHGNGPLPTHDGQLDPLPEPHNASDSWQGGFRRGHPDALLLRYALSVAGRLDGLLVSHLDVFARPAPLALRWCESYNAMADRDDSAAAGHPVCVRDPQTHMVTALVPGRHHDLLHQERLARLLARACPHYAPHAMLTARGFVDRLEVLAGLPVLLGAFGPTHTTVRERALL